MALTLKSGFSFDYDNLFGEGKVTQADLDELKDRLSAAHEAMGVMREKGFIKAHLSKDGEPEKVLFSQLPYIEDGNLNSPESLARLRKLTDHVRDNIDIVVSLGIGGSYLCDVFCGEFWNAKSPMERGGLPKVFFSGNNIDPRRTGDLIHYIESEAKRFGPKKCPHHQPREERKLKVMLIVISKSGGTLDTMSNFMVIYDALKKNPDIEVEIVAVTDPNMEKKTLLKQLAVENNWETFAVPDGVGGRFTIFCEVGLSTAAVIGMDIWSFLKGAQDMDKACQNPNVMENPAMLNAALKFIASEKYGRHCEVMMPYGDYLKSVSEWYIQLLASGSLLRKDTDCCSRHDGYACSDSATSGRCT